MNRGEILARLSTNSTVLVCGLGITGIETALWLRREGRAVTVVEKLSKAQYLAKDKFFRIDELLSSGVNLEFGIEGEAVVPFVKKYDVKLAILSPGISLTSALVGALKRVDVPCVTELEIGVLLAGVPTVMVTGSNGKSTTVSLIHHLLTACGKRSLLCGNVGTPVVSEFRSGELEHGLGDRFDWLVVEASSYQLEACESLAPDIGVILNLSDNHLERHGSMERYREAKFSMIARQTKSQYAIINRDDPLLMGVSARIPSMMLTFGRAAGFSGIGAVISDSAVTIGGLESELKFDTKSLQLIGAHNHENVAAALSVLVAAKIDLSNAQAALNSFVPLEHRLEMVTTFNDALILNDSKSTTVASTVAAIKAVLNHSSLVPAGKSKLVLCVGGAAKTGSWNPLIAELKKVSSQVSEIICFGRDGAMIADHIESNTTLKVVIEPNVATCVARALSAIKPREVLLFSPGCASFDEFSDFEHRGREFKKEVRRLTSDNQSDKVDRSTTLTINA